jgi:hypothetical protein
MIIPAGQLVVCYVYGENRAEEHFAMDVYKDSLKAWKEAGLSVYKSNCSTVSFKSSLSFTKTKQQVSNGLSAAYSIIEQ